MTQSKIKVLNIDVLATTQKELLQSLKKGTLITPNLDHLVKLQKEKSFMTYIKKQNGWFVIVKFFIFSLNC